MKLNTKTSWLILMAHSVLLYCCVRNISHGMGHIISSYMSVFVQLSSTLCPKQMTLMLDAIASTQFLGFMLTQTHSLGDIGK